MFTPLALRLAVLVLPLSAAAHAATDALPPLPVSFDAVGTDERGRVFVAHARRYAVAITATATTVSSAAPAARIRMELHGAETTAALVGESREPGVAHYYSGPDPRSWRHHVDRYARVVARGVYRGIDLVHYGSDGRLEQDFVLKPGAEPEAIRIGFEGHDGLEIEPSGDLLIRVGEEEVLRFKKPVSYQEDGGSRRAVASAFVLQRPDEVSFQVGAYDRSRTLVIDPVLEQSTYLGATGHDEGDGIARDGDGYIYVCGLTTSTDFPTQGAVQPTHGGGTYDGFLVKLDPSASAVVYATYLGGAGGDGNCDLAVDAAGNAYLGGRATPGFPILNAAQPAFGGGMLDAFVAKLDAGGALVYSTFFGGPESEWANGVAVDAGGHAYITGDAGPGLPVVNALQPVHRGFIDAFVAKLSADGSAFLYATYLGGSSSEGGSALAVDAAGALYVVGGTSSTDFPTANAFQPQRAARSDGFVTKIDAAGTALVYSTYLGGSMSESVSEIAVDGAGNAWIVGTSHSPDLPASADALQPALAAGTCAFDEPCRDGFVARLDSGGGLAYLSYLGGMETDSADAVALGDAGEVYITGGVRSFDFPIANAVQPLSGSATFFRSTTAGASWTGIHGGLPNRTTVLAADPQNAGVLYAGTRRGPGSPAVGVFKSTDGGATWVRRGSGLPGSAVVTVAVDKTAPLTVYATTFGSGVFKSTDGASTWAAINGGLLDLNVLSFLVHPADSATLYAGTLSGVFKSVDGGVSWIQSGLAGISVSVLITHRLLPSVVYAGTQGAGVFKTIDGGAAWAPASAGLTSLVVNALALDPVVPLTIYAGTQGGGVFKSQNGALTWLPSSAGLGSSNVTALATGNGPAAALYAGTAEQGVFKSTNGAESWAAAESGITNRMMIAVMVDPFDAARIYATASGGGADAYVLKLDPTGARLVYGTFLGGGSSESGRALVAGAFGAVHVIGWTQSDNFPVANAFQGAYRGGTDAFLSKIADPGF